ncbi:hypothetical protein CJ030_MR8G029144 [Morella rubra]|uniref:Uncharacterized protein n=1 Tax=Morella rubra TaxID=262757 RepID=A0A6A1UNS5_9ROSI|nr:hypothetical protein CJ030_MR8G029144 [Morella rubra]
MTLVDYVLEGGIDEMVDPGILTGERRAIIEQQFQAVLHLALICADRNPERRPTMVEVKKELRRIERSGRLLGIFCRAKWLSAEHFLWVLTTCFVFFCELEAESLEHIFFFCPRAVLAWRESPWGLQTLCLRDCSILDWITALLDPVAYLEFSEDQSVHLIRYGAILMDVIWLSRNQLLHQGKRDDVRTIIRRIHRLFSDWSIAPILRDIKALMEDHVSWTFSHVRRGANLLAHNVAKWAVSENLEGSIPSRCLPFDILYSDNPPLPP